MTPAAAALALLTAAVVAVPVQEEAPRPRQQRGRAIEGLAETTGDEALRRFAEGHLAPAYVAGFASREALYERLGTIRSACAGFGGVLWQPLGADGMRIRFLQEGRETVLVFRIEPQPPFRIVALDVEGTRPAEGGRSIEPFTWENVEARLDAEAKAGFSGTVLLVRGGRIVLHKGYGMANRERGLPNTTGTVFAIGSVPIDFSRAAVLKLEEMGKMRASDPITRYLPDVPPDKAAMTIAHLMSRRSGLPNFHHVEGDPDRDLSWIDRATAIRRILGQPLLFAPGQGEAHSHSAWGLLAAIVEIVSGQGYGAFLRQHFFDPAGMTRTGLHEDALGLPDGAFAVGYGHRSVGRVNVPKYWGRTSWLVMGSGGMQSTPLDLYRWMQAIRAGKTLSPESARRYGPGAPWPAATSGGSTRCTRRAPRT